MRSPILSTFHCGESFDDKADFGDIECMRVSENCHHHSLIESSFLFLDHFDHFMVKINCFYVRDDDDDDDDEMTTDATTPLQ